MRINCIKLILFFFLIYTSSIYAKVQYSMEHQKQFEKTGICIGCNLYGASLRAHHKANLSKSVLVSASIDNHNGLEFWESNFSYAKMTNAHFQYIRAAGSNFSNADLTNIKLYGADLSNSNFTGAQLKNADLSDADLTCSNITDEQLSKASSLSRTILPNGKTHP